MGTLLVSELLASLTICRVGQSTALRGSPTPLSRSFVSETSFPHSAQNWSPGSMTAKQNGQTGLGILSLTREGLAFCSSSSVTTTERRISRYISLSGCTDSSALRTAKRGSFAVNDSRKRLQTLTEADTLAVAAPDTETIAPTLSEAETLAVAAADAEKLWPTLTKADTVAVQIAETDTIAPTLTEVSSLQQFKTDTDTLTVTLTEIETLTVNLADTDTLARTLTEEDAVAAAIVETDTVTPMLTEADSKAVAITEHDTLTVTLTEAELELELRRRIGDYVV